MFKELYYWMTTCLAKVKSNDDPPYNAYFVICFLQSFNIGTLIIIANYFAKIRFAKGAYIYLGLSLALILCVINYNTLYKKREGIFKKYEKLTPTRKIKGLIYFWLYVFLSTIIFFVSGANLVSTN